MHCAELIEEVARARADSHRTPHESTVERLSTALSRFTGTAANQHYAATLSPTGNYTRVLLNSPADEFQVVLVLWGPGMGSPIHDHDETVGVVSALLGETEEIKYEVAEQDGGEVALAERSRFRINPARVTELLPETDKRMHRMVNETDRWSATVHVYLFGIHRYRIFEHRGGDRYLPAETRLWFDRTDVAGEMPAR